MQPLRRFALAFLALAAFALPARATTYSTDFTDLWFNPAESGWGVNVIQQYNTIFATLFVYGANNAAQWFVAPDVEPSPAGSQTVFTGQLFLTNGPFFGATAFDPNSVGKLVVGNITFTFDSATTGTLTYTVNGAPVTKRIQRQTWRNNVITGNYLGGLTAIGSNCSQVANGPVLIFQTLTVTQSGANNSLNVHFNAVPSGQPADCTFTGPYTQAGKLGSITGNWSCTLGNTGTFTLSSIQADTNGFTGKFTGHDQFCTYDGQFGGVRDVPLQ